MSFKEITPSKIQRNVFDMIGKDWMLITATSKDSANAMTASWGGLGVMWNKNVVYTVIRPTRFTYELVENLDFFSICFLDDSYRKELSYLGKVSGKEEDKIKKCGFSVLNEDGVPYFAESNLVLICKKLYFMDIKPEGFVGLKPEEAYPEENYHRQYTSEIIKTLIKE